MYFFAFGITFRQRDGADTFFEAFGNNFCFFAVGARKHDDHFVPAEAARNIRLAQAGADYAADFFKGPVADLVPIAVVNLFKPIYIHNN